MEPSQVRRRILKEHATFKAHLGELETIAKRVLAGERDLIDVLNDRQRLLLEDVEQQSALEDAILAPTLLEADAWGPVRAKRLVEHHERQRRDVDILRERTTNDATPEETARLALTVIDDLRTHVVEEELELLNQAVLRDDPIGEDVETG